MANTDVLSVDEVALELGYSQFHIRRLISQGDLIATKKSRVWLINPKDVKKFRENRAKKSPKKES